MKHWMIRMMLLPVLLAGVAGCSDEEAGSASANITLNGASYVGDSNNCAADEAGFYNSALAATVSHGVLCEFNTYSVAVGQKEGTEEHLVDVTEISSGDHSRCSTTGETHAQCGQDTVSYDSASKKYTFTAANLTGATPISQISGVMTE